MPNELCTPPGAVMSSLDRASDLIDPKQRWDIQVFAGTDLIEY